MRKIAVAVDGSLNCECAVRYVTGIAAAIPDLHFVLVHIQPPLSQYLTEEAERKPKALKALRALMKSNKAESEKMLDKAKNEMVRRGIDPLRIEPCSRVRFSGVAEDILDLCQTRSFDALAIARRGITRLQEMITGSVTTSLLEHARLTPTWVVDGDASNPNFLLAVDGSPNSLRALDHMAFMLAGGSIDHRIHMLHIKPRLQDFCEIDFDPDAMAAAEQVLLDDDRRCIDDFHAQALGVLKKNGFPPDRLQIRTIDNRLSIARAIRDTAAELKCGTIVVGRRGRTEGKFTGSVSRKVIQKATDTAVWLVP
ncbi:MAG: universal stress protein [Desulfatitalea sp.]|nr:universal stress protein [Desulfatitalea sp.]NNK01709.1 universal stress protein [Desulfatitalea sp.]